MKILGFGGVVPFLGFRKTIVPCEEAAELGITRTRLLEGDMDMVWIEVFEVEWFGFGITFFARGIE